MPDFLASSFFTISKQHGSDRHVDYDVLRDAHTSKFGLPVQNSIAAHPAMENCLEQAWDIPFVPNVPMNEIHHALVGPKLVKFLSQESFKHTNAGTIRQIASRQQVTMRTVQTIRRNNLNSPNSRKRTKINKHEKFVHDEKRKPAAIAAGPHHKVSSEQPSRFDDLVLMDMYSQVTMLCPINSTAIFCKLCHIRKSKKNLCNLMCGPQWPEHPIRNLHHTRNKNAFSTCRFFACRTVKEIRKF